ncbi:glycoside hydrolase family 78 protein [Mollisia scopiformis]|uniref:Glycoside hydrolase family 78 protein n=1 Tax=Mollisia scopiformis TaxID=149040 RepID=A0A132BEV4_MOLSC|nr:glycoside hydrolase family 78 protein [Mollisia scopiformis]KUJ10549.1 glycoside hydrolase family 78 protein [Mollisia scopiformis]
MSQLLFGWISTTFQPLTLALGAGPLYPVNTFQAFALNAQTPFATLDYGHEVAGYPIFDVLSLTGKVEIEVKYAEQFSDLSAPFSDGPYPFAVGLSNTYRVETFNITEPGLISAFLLQGGLRWQSIRLLTSGSIAISAVGLNASISTTDVDALPGDFSCDNTLLNEIWELGARTVGVACVDRGSQKAIWEVSGNGVFVRGMRPGVSANVSAAELQNYTLQFDVNIQRAGMGWAVATPLQSPNTGIYLNIVGDLPSATTFVNTNTSLTPPNSIVLAYGYSLVNQTTLPSYYLDTFKLPLPLQENTWHTIETVLLGGQYLAVLVDKTEIFNNVFVYDTASGSLLYNNSMTNATIVLPEYGVHENFASVCLDGGKRDRLVWVGDFYHTSQIIGASTSRDDLIQGTLQYFLDWQTSVGLVPIDSPMGYDHSIAESAFTLGGGGASPFQILGLIAFTNYVIQSNDLAWTVKTWPQWQLQAEWILSQINSTNGLLSFEDAFLGGANGGSAINCALLKALNRVAFVANAIGDTASAAKYQTAATSLLAAINKYLWNAKLGFYSLDLDSLNDYSVVGLSFCITSGAANASQAAQSLAAVFALKLGPGFKDSSQVNSSDPTVNLSPFTNGFLLEALLSQNNSGSAASCSTALQLITTLWGAMLANNQTSTGTTWEYVDQTGQPGLSLFTSSAAAWAGAPTYLITRYVAGLQQAAGVAGFGYRNWVFNPSAGLAMGLKTSNATVITAFGGPLSVQWQVVAIASGNQLKVTISAPAATSGVFELNGTRKVLNGSAAYSFVMSM